MSCGSEEGSMFVICCGCAAVVVVLLCRRGAVASVEIALVRRLVGVRDLAGRVSPKRCG